MHSITKQNRMEQQIKVEVDPCNSKSNEDSKEGELRILIEILEPKMTEPKKEGQPKKPIRKK